ncbi:hypothetical protein POM88_014468 [Heracleum sosnowskyi]|uniref:RING-type domain-containing protein n=1 Tax=Heracleum sosnowskyi TaxID=360622 RepID=A0AAD8J3Q7_9APIA|nr:hypothetical protein POM88_014468 [Heracleum sosnowskyi]
MDGLNVDQVVEVPDKPDRLTSQSINGIDCTSDISDGGWKNKNKQATRTDSGRMLFPPPCSGSNKSGLQGNIQKIASRTTPPSESAFYSKGNAVENTPNRLASHDRNVIDCAADISDDGWKNKNKRARRTKSRRMFISPCNGPNRSELHGNIQKIASRTTPSKSAFYQKENAVDNTPDALASQSVNVIDCASDISNDGWRNKNKRATIRKRQANSSSQFQMPACQGHSNVIDQSKLGGHSNICQNYVTESGQREQFRKEMVDKSFSPLLIADDTDTGEIYEKPRTSHRIQIFDSQQDDSGSNRELTIKEMDSRRLKGKGIVTEEEFYEKRKPLSGRTLAGKSDGVGPANKEACVRSEESSGWISTHKRTRKLNSSLSDEEHLCHKEDDLHNVTKRPRNAVVRRDYEDGSNARNHSVSSLNLSMPPISLISSQNRRGCLINEKPRTSHRTQKFDSQQGDSGTSRELTVKEKDSRRLKGKGILIEEEFDEKRKPLSGRTLAGNLDGVGPANKEACVRSEESSEWMSTRKRTRKSNPSLSDEEHLFHKEDDPCNVTKRPRNVVVRRDNEDGSDARNHSVSSLNLSMSPMPLTLSQERRGCLLNEHRGSSNTAVKRRKKSSGTHHSGSSSSPIGKSEVLGFGSSGRPSNVRSVGTQNSRTANSLSRIIDIDDFSPERSNGSHNRDCSRNSESDVRVIQVEDDEILALELQEQLYNESNVAADREIDEQIALELQQWSFDRTFPSGSHHESHSTSRQNLSESSRNSSTHRVTQDRDPTATRMPQPRRHFPAERRRISSRQRNSLYPPSTDVDMRMHFLEALESVNNIGVASGLLQFQRDFNENDYEMLLALDENNYQHCGASEARINGLPESTVQTDNLEACSVCLETPSIGDTMRHLPCLHRFHKDCIDEWLRRRSSCPICKSFI